MNVLLLIFSFNCFILNLVVCQNLFPNYKYNEALKILIKQKRKKEFLEHEFYSNGYSYFTSKKDANLAHFKVIPTVILSLEFDSKDSLNLFKYYQVCFTSIHAFLYKKEQLTTIIDLSKDSKRGYHQDVILDYSKSGYPEFFKENYENVFYDYVLKEYCIKEKDKIYCYDSENRKIKFLEELIIERFNSWTFFKECLIGWNESMLNK